MHETFCFWDFNDWKKQLRAAGFKIHPDSKSFTNPWIVENRWKGKAALFTLQEGKLVAEKYPVTTMFLIGIKTIG
jgi:O-glycosyl hydrolase